MANNDNLLPPFGKGRSSDEARAAGRAGGIASGKARRRKKTMREAAEQILLMSPPDKLAETLRKQGFAEEDVTYQMVVVLGQIQAAAKGNTGAASFIADLLGEKNVKMAPADDDGFIEALAGTASEDWKDGDES